MNKHIFYYLAAVIICLFYVNTNVFAEPAVIQPLVVCVMGESKEYNNAVASLVLENDTNARLKDIEIRDFKPMELYEAKNNPNLKVAVITYDPKIDDFNQIESVFKNKFDCMDILLHVSDKKTFTYEKITKFYDTFNEAWVGKDVYKTMKYLPYGEHRLNMWYYLLQKYGKHYLPRTTFFIYYGKVQELKSNKEFLDSLESYISAMPDSRDVVTLDFVSLIFVNRDREACQNVLPQNSLKKIEKLNEDKKKIPTALYGTIHSLGKTKNKTKKQMPLLPIILVSSTVLVALGSFGIYKLYNYLKKENKCLALNSQKPLQKASQC